MAHGMKTVLERFEDKFVPEPNSGCFLWTAAAGKGGYGHFGMNGTVLDAHRASYRLYKGEIPSGLSVLHRCDVKACVNPAHLFLGTQKQNLEDMTQKGRRKSASGEMSGAAKLTVEKARSIHADTRPHREIANDYGVGKTIIGSIKQGKYWRTA